MYKISKLWIDTLENRDAYGYKTVGFVTTIELAEKFANFKHIPKSKYPWPLDYAVEYPGDTVPLFKYKKIKSLDDITDEELTFMAGKL